MFQSKPKDVTVPYVPLETHPGTKIVHLMALFHCMVRYGSARLGKVRYGTAQFGSVCVSTAV